MPTKPQTFPELISSRELPDGTKAFVYADALGVTVTSTFGECGNQHLLTDCGVLRYLATTRLMDTQSTHWLRETVIAAWSRSEELRASERARRMAEAEIELRPAVEGDGVVWTRVTMPGVSA